MIINYVHCQMLRGSKKQASEFTVASSLLEAINPMWVTVLNKVAPSPEQEPQMTHIWTHHGFFCLSSAYNPSRKYPFQDVISRNLPNYLSFGFSGFFNRTLWPTRAKFGCKPVDLTNCIFGIDGLPGTEMKTTVVLGGIFINKYIFQKK